jgi:hypothetical protein
MKLTLRYSTKAFLFIAFTLYVMFHFAEMIWGEQLGIALL